LAICDLKEGNLSISSCRNKSFRDFHEANSENHVARHFNRLLTLTLPVEPHLNRSITAASNKLNVIFVLLGTLLAFEIRVHFRVQNLHARNVFSVAEFLEARLWIMLLRLNIFEVLGFHIRQCLVLKQHIVHELVPLNAAIRVSINFHEELVELLVTHALANDFFKRIEELELILVKLVLLPLLGLVNHRHQHQQPRISPSTP
jgi:hypothetical protein